MKVDASFVTSALGADDLPRDTRATIALVGRSNVGKSSLINALVRQQIARTSASPGKTRMANIYRVARGDSPPFYLVDLPGYGFATALSQREALEGSEPKASRRARASGGGAPRAVKEAGGGSFADIAAAVFGRHPAAVLLVDSRHPGLDNDLAAWEWLQQTVDGELAVVVATKIDKLARGQRIRAMRELESVFDAPVTPCSAVTGEGLDDLWKLMHRLANSRDPRRRSSPPKGTAPHPPKR